MKKILSILCLCFILPMNLNSAFEVVDPEMKAAMALAEKGIIVEQLSSAGYKLGKDIQRQATIKIVMKLSGKNVPEACRGEFSDVDTTTWPCKYIEAALDAGYVAGNNTFRPFDSITMTEAMKLVLKAKGVEKTQETDSWQEDYMETAYHYGIIDKKYYNFDDNATRGWIFQIATAVIEKEEEIKSIQDEMIMSNEVL